MIFRCWDPIDLGHTEADAQAQNAHSAAEAARAWVERRWDRDDYMAEREVWVRVPEHGSVCVQEAGSIVLVRVVAEPSVTFRAEVERVISPAEARKP